jgi:hypothetical protein
MTDAMMTDDRSKESVPSVIGHLSIGHAGASKSLLSSRIS